MTTAGQAITWTRRGRPASETALGWIAACAITLGLGLGLGADALMERASQQDTVASPVTMELPTIAPAPTLSGPDWAGVLSPALMKEAARSPWSSPSFSANAPRSDSAFLNAGADRAPGGAGASRACLPVVAIPFERKSAQVEAADLEAPTAPLRAWLAAHPNAVLLVQGHAGARGKDRDNVLLSYARAQAVADWLHGAGVPQRQLNVVGAGTRPAQFTAENRVAVLEVMGVDRCADRREF